MNPRRILRILWAVGFVLAGPAVAEETLPTSLSPEQMRVLARARERFGQDWRVMTDASDERASTVVFLGEAEAYSAEELEVVKTVVDRFEHFVVERADAKVADSPANVVELGRITKSVARIDAPVPSAAIVPMRETPPRTLRDMLAQALNAEIVPPAVRLPVALLWGAAAAGDIVWMYLPRHRASTIRRQSVRAIASFVLRWTQTNKSAGPLVAFVRASLLPRLQDRLTHRFSFRAGIPDCGRAACEVRPVR